MDNERHTLEEKPTTEDRVMRLKEAAEQLWLKPETLIKNYIKCKPQKLRAFQYTPQGPWMVKQSEVDRFLREELTTE